MTALLPVGRPVDPRNLTYRSDSDDFVEVYEVFDRSTPIGLIERGLIPAAHPHLPPRQGWAFESVDGRFGIGDTRAEAITDALRK